ncbi:MAG: hypothetical protein IJQ42_08325 [Oscillospiraceae bacterium]|jgi:hypothetical protein|nr:hypothetical protein [Oscillospiraceae bacterium]MBR7074607.1 hypothetical protein [Oscillospiraceae bacterium]
MSKNEQKTVKSGSKMPEFLRKLFVSLKRRPSILALLVLAIGFLFYSLNLTQISNTTAKIQGPGMGLCGFATMLFSMLSLVCALNAYPRRKKPVIPMLILAVLMLGVIIFCDVYYTGLITAAVTRAENPIKIDSSTIYIAKANNMLWDHIVIEIIGAAMFLLVPVYSKLLRKINTSVTVEDYGKMGAIDISGED